MAKFRFGKNVTCMVCGDKAYLRYSESFVTSDKTCDCKGGRLVSMAQGHPEPDACCGHCEEQETVQISKRQKCPCKPKED